jgi:iron complex transport system substrate-binding protein
MYGHSTPRRNPAWLPLLTGVLVCALMLAFALAVAGCGSGDQKAGTTAVVAEAKFPVILTDDVGGTATIQARPTRIVSTAPSNTQILFALGVGDRVVGVNSLDDYPAEVADIAKVGDYQVNTEAVMALSPDLVLGYSGNEEGLAPVKAAGAPVLIFNPSTLEGIYANIQTIGQAVGASTQASQVVADMKASIQQIADAAKATGESPRVFYVIDATQQPYTCGSGTFVDELLKLASATNIASEDTSAAAQGYYPMAPEKLLAADPDIVLLSGLAFADVDQFTSDARFAGLSAVKEGRVFILDAQYDKLLTIPGPRIVEGFRALVETIHPSADLAE